MRVSIQSESDLVHRVVAHALEWDSNVIGYLDQPAPVDAAFSRDGRQTGRKAMILDYLFVSTDGTCWAVRCMTRESLDRRLAKKPHLYARDADGIAQYLPVVQSLGKLGVRHRVLTPDEMGPMLVRNFEFLSAYRNQYICNTDVEGITDAVKEGPRTIVAVAAAAGVPVDAVLRSICRGHVFADLKRCPLVETEYTLVHPDLRAMAAYADDRSMTVSNGEFGDLVKNGAIPRHAPRIAENSATEISDLLWEYAGKDGGRKGKIILRRLDILRQIRLDNLAVDEAAARLGACRRTVYNYLERYDAAGTAPGEKFRSQVPYARKPVEKPRTQAHERLDAWIMRHYYRKGRRTKPRLTVRQAYQRYSRLERKTGGQPFSLTTYRKRIKELGTPMAVQHRDGKYAADAASPSVGLPSSRLGEWPFHRVQFDGTVMDVALDCYENNVGPRPWTDRPRLLIAVDSFSRAVVAWYIDFQAESAEMALLTVRDLVRRHHRIPDISVFDHGPGFVSGALRLLLLGYCQRETMFRPPGEPKFSGQVERVFETISDQLVKNIAGYMGRLQARRALTKRPDPRKDAIWALEGLEKFVSAFFALYNDTVHEEIGMTPNEALHDGWALRGNRASQRLVYDEQFRRATMPATSKKYVLDPKAGFHFRRNRYRNPSVSQAAGRLPNGKRTFHLHYDPEDSATVYARIDGAFHPFRADRAERLDSLAQKEDRVLISKALEIEKRDARREARAGNNRLTDLLVAIDEEQEALARARRKALTNARGGRNDGDEAGDESGTGLPPDSVVESKPPFVLNYLDGMDVQAGGHEND